MKNRLVVVRALGLWGAEGQLQKKNTQDLVVGMFCALIASISVSWLRYLTMDVKDGTIGGNCVKSVGHLSELFLTPHTYFYLKFKHLI